jgi:hypothetical protein
MHYKLEEGDDYHVSSEFSQYMIKVLKIDANHLETRDWWNGIRGYAGYEIHQAMKRIVLGMHFTPVSFLLHNIISYTILLVNQMHTNVILIFCLT